MSSAKITLLSLAPDLVAQFRSSIINYGMEPPEQIIADGQYHRFSTNGKQSDKAGWYVLDLSGQPHGAFGCWRSGISYAWKPNFSGEIGPTERELFRQRQVQSERKRQEEQRRQWAINADNNKKLLSQAKAPGEEVRSYLASRGLGGWNIPSCIRQHPGLAYWHQDEDGEQKNLGTYPVMLAPIVNDGAVVSLHRTYLCDGNKAPVPQPKKLTSASGLLAGGCIPLANKFSGDLGVAEGIETAAAATLGSGLPVVAAYSASAMAAYKWPPHTRRLIIFADNDQAGRKAAQDLAGRAKNFGVDFKIMTPEQPGYDWADVWQEGQQ